MSDLPWVEKYRPTTIKDIIGNNEIKIILSNILKHNIEMPHFLFYGPPGNGKTSTIIAFAKELYGNTFNYNVLQLNASVNNGIDSIRNIIMNFAKNKVKNNTNNINYTLIILDEADTLTIDAQTSLRKIMETYSETTKFCIICNYINKINYPIISRCVLVKFNALSIDNIRTQLYKISEREHMNINLNIINAIIETSNNDMRKSISLLQNLKNYYNTNFNITCDLIYDINNDISIQTINDIINIIRNNTIIYSFKYISYFNIPLLKLCEKIILYVPLNTIIIIKILKIMDNIVLNNNDSIQLLKLISIVKNKK